MTLNRRLSIFTFALLLLLCTVGATGVAILLTIRPALLTHKNVILDRYGLDDALTLLSTMTTTAVVVTAGLGLLVRRSVRKRLSQFQLPQGLAAAALKHDVGDELDHAAQQLNALGTTIAQLRAKERSEDEVDAARRFTENIIQSMFDVLIVTDPDLKIVNVNRAACVLLEYSELESDRQADRGNLQGRKHHDRPAGAADAQEQFDARQRNDLSHGKRAVCFNGWCRLR